MNLYFIEITDTFGGEANYSWVTRHIIRASTARGAMRKISTRSGLSFRKTDETYDYIRYDSKSGATCAFVAYYEPEHDDQYRIDTDDRKGETK